MHLIIFIWGFTGILGVLIKLEALELVWHRLLIGFISLFIGLLILRRNWRIRGWKLNLATLGVGLLVTTHWVTFYISIQLSTASLGILCLSTATLHVSWLEPLIRRTPFSWAEFLFGFLVIGGIYIVSQDFSANDYEALAFGLVSALCAAAFNVFNGKLVKYVNSGAITLYELGFGLVLLSFVLMYQGNFNQELFSMTLSDLLWLLFLGIICTSLAFLLTIDIIDKLGSFTVSLSINLEPIYTMLLAVFILNEHELLSLRFYLGATIIIGVVIANALYKHFRKIRKAKASPQP